MLDNTFFATSILELKVLANLITYSYAPWRPNETDGSSLIIKKNVRVNFPKQEVVN